MSMRLEYESSSELLHISIEPGCCTGLPLADFTWKLIIFGKCNLLHLTIFTRHVKAFVSSCSLLLNVLSKITYHMRFKVEYGRLICTPGHQPRSDWRYKVGHAVALIVASVYDKYPVGPSIRSICTRFCFTMTNMTQASGDFHSALVFFRNIRPDEIHLAKRGWVMRSFPLAKSGRANRQFARAKPGWATRQFVFEN